MYRYIIGMVKEQEANYIILECNNIGYLIYVANPYLYEINKEYKIYLYNQIREDENSLYGFKNKEELDLFLKLINVKGLGPKMANGFFATGSVNGIIDAINRENILYLTKFPKIGEKIAKQIILDLKGKLNVINRVFDSNSNFVLCKLENSTDNELFEFALSKGILIRKCGNYRGLDSSFIRLAVKSRENNEILLDMLKCFENIRRD